MLVSVTRLRLRSWRFLLLFVIHASRSQKQAERTEGCRSVRVRKTQGSTFWTLTTWEGEAYLRRFLSGGPHRVVMPKLMQWCDEAAMAHWSQDGNVPPTWEEAALKLKAIGRLSRVLHPSPMQRAGTLNIT
jgi:hypothetical protein